jgi:Polyketide cyclase / dehydrase and lipid transport
MKFGRLFLFFLLAVIATTAILSFMQPTSQKVERSIIINATAAVIYDQLIKLDNFNKFSVWSQQDSTAVYTLSGTDGTVGASSSWKGSPEISGEGKIEIIGLERNRKVTHQFHFTQPKKGKAESTFSLNETNKATTTVTWTFKMATPRPWNIFNLFYSLDKQIGKDFEDGLTAMKKMIELSNNQTKPGNN